MEMSAAFAAIGLFASWWIWSKTSNTQLASGVFFFFTMELLQAIQYLFIAPNIDSPICDTIINQVLTIAGFLHICLQPYFCHVINASLTKNAKYIDRYLVIKRLCLMGKIFKKLFVLCYILYFRWFNVIRTIFIGLSMATNNERPINGMVTGKEIMYISRYGNIFLSLLKY
jgi:hypothetical protein